MYVLFYTGEKCEEAYKKFRGFDTKIEQSFKKFCADCHVMTTEFCQYMTIKDNENDVLFSRKGRNMYIFNDTGE